MGFLVFSSTIEGVSDQVPARKPGYLPMAAIRVGIGSPLSRRRTLQGDWIDPVSGLRAVPFKCKKNAR